MVGRSSGCFIDVLCNVLFFFFSFALLPLWFLGSFFDDIEGRNSIVISATWMCTLEEHAVKLLNA